MPDKEDKSPYEQLLSMYNDLKTEFNDFKVKYNEVVEFNKALLDRKSKTEDINKVDVDTKKAKEKLDKFMEED